MSSHHTLWHFTAINDCDVVQHFTFYFPWPFRRWIQILIIASRSNYKKEYIPEYFANFSNSLSDNVVKCNLDNSFNRLYRLNLKMFKFNEMKCYSCLPPVKFWNSFKPRFHFIFKRGSNAILVFGYLMLSNLMGMVKMSINIRNDQ